MNRLFITALLASVAFAPAYAGKKDKGDNILEQIQDRLEDKALDKYEDKIERLEGRLEGAGDEERQRIENIIESVTEKYEAKWGELPEEPPPPPEDTSLFKDDFNRDQTAPGNGWVTRDASIDEQRLKLTGGSTNAEAFAYYTVDLKGGAYKNFTITYDIEPNSGSAAYEELVVFWSKGDPSHANEQIGAVTHPLSMTDPHTGSFTTRDSTIDDPYTSFSFGFKTNGTAWIDNVVITGELWEAPAGDFVGY
jgi:hypothetical protein